MKLRKFIATLIREHLNENKKLGKIYPDINLEPMKKLSLQFLGGDIGFDIMDAVNNEEIGVVVLKEIDDVENVIYSIFIAPEFRGRSFAIPTYIKLAEILGFVCSGEYRNNGDLTSFVSKDADKVWKRLNEYFKLEKIPIQGDKFRYCLKKENL